MTIFIGMADQEKDALSKDINQVAVPPFMEDLVRPMAMATAITGQCVDYKAEVERGDTYYPAYKRRGSVDELLKGRKPEVQKNSNALEIWEDTRTEAFIEFVKFGAANAAIICDPVKQDFLLAEFFRLNIRYGFKYQPTGNCDHDSLLAIIKVYHHLTRIGEELCDNDTGH